MWLNINDDAYSAYIVDNAGSVTAVTSIIPTITWNNPDDIIEGTALGDDQLNAVASEPGSFDYTPKAGTILSAGTHKLHVEFTPNNNDNYESTSADATINVLTPAQGTQKTLDDVQNLVNSGKINSGQGNSLTVKLNNAISDLNAGETKKAINDLNAFINEVNSYIDNGVLKKNEGQKLINGANAVINAIQ